MERVNRLEKDLKALKNKVARLEKNGGRSKNGGDVPASTPAPAAAAAAAPDPVNEENRSKEGGIGKFLDGLFGTKAPEGESEMRDVAGSMSGGRAKQQRNNRRNKKSRKNKRSAKRGGGAGCAKRNARKNKKNTRRNKNQRRRTTRRRQHGGG